MSTTKHNNQSTAVTWQHTVITGGPGIMGSQHQLMTYQSLTHRDHVAAVVIAENPDGSIGVVSEHRTMGQANRAMRTLRPTCPASTIYTTEVWHSKCVGVDNNAEVAA